jgi:peptidoglycan-associated lipoprotein
MFRRLVAGLFILVCVPCFVIILACAGNKASTPRATSAEVAESPPPDDTVPPEGAHSLPAAAGSEISAGRQEFAEVDIYFNKGSAALSSQAKDKLSAKARWLKENSHVRVVIQGHSDEPGSAEYNFALGDRRAGTVKSYLIGLGIAPSRMAAVSYGKEQPAVAGQPDRNRRVHFEIETLD